MNSCKGITLGIILSIVLLCLGCEVQPPSSSGTSASVFDASVNGFATSIDPYEKYSRDEIYAMLEEFMYAHPGVYASGLAVVGGLNNLKSFYYIYKDGTTFVTIDGFDYGSVDAGVFRSIQQRVMQGEQFWSQSYVREDGSGNRIRVSTLFTPIVNDSGQVVYVLTVDRIEENG